ncbi:hypothetical protein RUM43_005643, partial [Polyplax serrata]
MITAIALEIARPAGGTRKHHQLYRAIPCLLREPFAYHTLIYTVRYKYKNSQTPENPSSDGRSLMKTRNVSFRLSTVFPFSPRPSIIPPARMIFEGE